jgi:hypothetical protein
MTRQATITTIIIGALALLLCASAAHANDMVNAGVDLAQRCMHKVLLSSLYGGVHDREPVTKLAVSVCEPDLLALVLHFEPAADKAKIHSSMIIEVHRQLDSIIANGEWNGE